MQTTRSSLETNSGPDDWFTGSIYIDTVATPGEDHWHGASPDRFMTHLATQEVDDSGSPVTWGEHVSDAEYGATSATGS